MTQNVIFKWAYDFLSDIFSETVTITGILTGSEYGTAEFGIAEYDGATNVNVISANGLSQGQVLQFGFEADIDGKQLSIQKVDLLTKNGRI